MEDKLLDEVLARVDALQDDMVRTQVDITAFPAISPKSGGEGEWDKAQYIESLLDEVGFDEVLEYNAPDPDAKKECRPNLIARVKGHNHDRTLWFMAHMDVVPPGDLKLWHTDPYKAVVKEGRIYGRGTEDNQQDLVASIYAIKAIRDAGVTPPHDVGLVIVADEETGSKYGLCHVLGEYDFKREDLIVVPDYPTPDGSKIEVAEKSIAWLRFVTHGGQCHASMPAKGNNAHRAAAHLLCEIDEMLHQRYGAKNELFDPPLSTFEPTKKEANVPNVNTIPGEDAFYFDCRILPQYDINEILSAIQEKAKGVERRFDVSIAIEPVQFEQAAPPTPADAEVVNLLSEAVKKIYGVCTKTVGIGGGTVAAYFRRAGYNVAVWGKGDETEHGPDEYCVIDNMVGDAKVYATMALHPE